MTTISVNGTAGNDLIDKTGTSSDYKITAGSGDDTAYGGAGNDYIDGGSDNDVLNGGAGNDILVGGSGNDTMIYRMSENVGATDSYDGGSGTADRLQLILTYDEWIRADVQHDIASAQNYLLPPGGKAFQFTAFNLSIKNTEYMDVYVNGVKMDLSNHPVTLNADGLTASEDSAGVAVNLLANDSVPDLVKAITVAQPQHGTVALTTDFSSVNVPVANAVYTPDATYWQYLAEGQTATETFAYKVTDANGDTATQTATVTITGANDPAVIGGQDTGTVKEDTTLTTTGKLTVTDVDTGQASFQAHDVTNPVQGAHGSLTIDTAGNWAYTLNNSDPAVQALNEGQSLSDKVTVHSLDGTEHAVNVTVNGANESSAPPYTYSFASVGDSTTYSWPSVGARAISNSGEIVGNYTDVNGVHHGAVINGGQYETVDVPGAAVTDVEGVNKLGQIVGYYVDSSGVQHGFVDTNGQFTPIDIPGSSGTSVGGINDRGQIVGSYGADNHGHGFILNPAPDGSYDLSSGASYVTVDDASDPWATLGGTLLSGINNNGQVVGYVADGGGSYRSFYYSGGANGQFEALSVPDSRKDQALGINDAGDISGWYTPNLGHDQAFVRYASGEYAKFIYPGADYTNGTGINNLGEVVGSFTVDDTTIHSFTAVPDYLLAV